MLIHLINLDRSADRLAEFMRVNDHLDEVCRVSAVDGSTLDLPALIHNGVIERGIAETYRRGGLGLVFSHISVWDKAIATGQVVTVCEDDAIFNRYYVRCAESVIDTAPPDWDLILWGWNFDSILAFELIPGVSPCVASFDQDRMREGVPSFQRQSLSPRRFRLLRAFGTICYSVSPKGAQSLKALCVPVREMNVYFPGVNRSLPNYGIDIMMSNAYPGINAFVTFPPLVVTKNDPNKATY
jgi:glycosyl transferase family 25